MGRHKQEVIDFAPPVEVIPGKRGPKPKPKPETEEKRGRGRPKKGEEPPPKPFVAYGKRSDTKPENRLKKAEKTIRSAEKLYAKYNSEFPNPLNIDVKNLDPAAKEAWYYIFSLRNYTRDKIISLKESTFQSPEEVLIAFEAFCGYIRDNNFMKKITRADDTVGALPIVPNMTNFARWMGVSRRTVRYVMDREPNAKEEYKSMLSDLLSEGAMIGAYTSASAIFTLKNLCDWADNPEDRGMRKEKDFVPVEEAEKALAELGYTRPKLLE